MSLAASNPSIPAAPSQPSLFVASDGASPGVCLLAEPAPAGRKLHSQRLEPQARITRVPQSAAAAPRLTAAPSLADAALADAAAPAPRALLTEDPPRAQRSVSARTRVPGSGCEVLGRRADPRGCVRELVVLPGAAGSRLVVDRLAFRGLDARLVAHLAADEPSTNARIAAELYLADSRPGCRALQAEDLLGPPLTQEVFRGADQLEDEHGAGYCVRLVACPTGQEARWVCANARNGSEQTLSVREVIGRLERPDQVRVRTAAAIASLRGEPGVSVAGLGAELRRFDASPIVLNRALRSAVLDAVSRHELSLSAIAMRCGRIKRDRRGRWSGETSWLARRVGLLAEGGTSAPTPWIHSDVLALIARRGLGIAPREVELG